MRYTPSAVATGILATALAICVASPAAATMSAPLTDETVVTSSSAASDFEVSEELEAYLATLTDRERAEFVRTMLPETTLTTTTYSPTDAQARNALADSSGPGVSINPFVTGCWTARANYSNLSIAGTVLYKWWHVTRWCAKGTTVTSASIADRGGQPVTIGWRYEGVAQSQAGIAGGWGRSYSQHKFVLGSGGWDIQTVMPCGRVSGGQSGASFYDRVCGIY